MPHYKSPINALHFLSDEDILNGGEALLPHGCVRITDAEAEQIRLAQGDVAPVAPTQDPIAKLRAFLALHPDVVAALEEK